MNTHLLVLVSPFENTAAPSTNNLTTLLSLYVVSIELPSV